MANENSFVEAAYKEALNYADKTIKLSSDVRKNYTESDAFYYDMKAKDIAIMVICFMVGVVALIFKGKVWEKLEEVVFSKVDFGVLVSYLSMIYTLGFVIVLLFGGWLLFKFIYANKTKAELNNLDKIASELEKEKGFAEGIKNTVIKAINNYEYITVGNPNRWEQKISNYQSKADGIGIKTRNIGKWAGIVGSIVAIIIFLVFFNPFIVDAIVEPFTYYGTLVVCASYLLLMGLIYGSQMILTAYMKKLAKYVGIILFALYQLALYIQLKSTNVFEPLISMSEYNLQGGPEWLAKVLQFAIKYLINEGLFVLLVVSIIGLMTLIRTDVEREYFVKQEGVDIPLDNGSSIHVEANSKWVSILLASAFTIIAPFLMSGILNKGASFGRVILYIVLGLVWFGISTTFTDEKTEAIYGKRLGWVKNAFFFAYMFLTLSLVPGFGAGSVILILIQPILSTIVVVIFAYVELQI